MNEIFLYSGVYDWTIQEILEKMSEIGEDQDITYRVNSGGGNVFSAQGWLADLKKRTGKNIQSMEGNASSMAFFSALYMDKVTALETTKALVHRADMWVESEEERVMLSQVNETFKELIKTRLDVAAFEKRAGMTVDDFFNPGAKNEIRNELWLSAEDLVAIGLVKKEDVLKISPELAATLKNAISSFGEYREPNSSIIESQPQSQSQKEINLLTNTNTIMELTAEQAVAQERVRVAAWNVWAKVDPDKVLAGIAGGKDISAADTQEFMLSLANSNSLKAIEEKSPEGVVLPKETTPESESKKELDALQSEILGELGLKTEVK